jgi:hypothetical protein
MTIILIALTVALVLVSVAAFAIRKLGRFMD